MPSRSRSRAARSESGLVRHLFVVLCLSLVSGLLMSGLFLPYVGALVFGAQRANTMVDEMPMRLPFGQLDQRTKVYDAEGKQIAMLYNKDRIYRPLDEISPVMVRALISIEDDRFYQHGAMDFEGTMRALVVNQTSSETQGGSSITQQLVKLVLLENAGADAEAQAAATDSSIARKVRELRYAMWVEDHFTKRQILEKYLNYAYFGDGAYGVEAAARHYFGSHADELTVPQAALLAGMVKNPTAYDPTNSRDEARARRDTVIDAMVRTGRLSKKVAEEAKSRKVRAKVRTPESGCLNSKSPLFCDFLEGWFLAQPRFGKTVEDRQRLLYGGGLEIHTTLDMEAQKASTEAVRARAYPTDDAVAGIAMVEPGTGYVRALAQSRPMGTDSKAGDTFINYAVPKIYGQSNGFQGGSTFKPFVLAAAAEKRIPLDTYLYSPATMYFNGSNFRTCHGPYTAENFDVSNFEGYSGSYDLYTGTQESVNTFYLQLEEKTGLCRPWHLAKKMGVPLQYPSKVGPNGEQPSMVPTFTLGIANTNPLSQAEAYATFGARGIHCDATPVMSIRDSRDRLLPGIKPSCERVMRESSADAVNDVLKGVMEPGGFGQGLMPTPDDGSYLESAGKTGTTQEGKAVWFMGYTPEIATAAMVAGANKYGTAVDLDSTTLGGYYEDVTGSGTAGPMWSSAMEGIVNSLDDKEFVAPVNYPGYGG